MITVFYDGKCSLCAREIRYYQSRQPLDFIQWVDVMDNKPKTQEMMKRIGLDTTTALKFFHVQDDQGKMHKGVDAFIVLWRGFKGWRLLAGFVSLPIIKQVAEFLYKVFAKWRFIRSPHCALVMRQHL